jgi:diguanylate cyclase
MALSRFPAYLTLVGRAGGLHLIERAPKPLVLHEVLRPAERDLLCGVATRQALLERLETVGSLAPAAALSFVVVKVEGIAAINRDRGLRDGDRVLRAVAELVKAYTRATDTVGRLTGASFGVVLQGTGSTGASAVAARLSFHLGQLAVDGRRVLAQVTVATGKGINADTLPVAAFDSFDDCG